MKGLKQVKGSGLERRLISRKTNTNVNNRAARRALAKQKGKTR